TGKLVAALPSSDNMSDLGDLADLAWTGPDQLAAADDGRCVLVWQLGPKPAKPTLFPAQARLDVRALAFGPGSGAPLAVALGNGACCLWDARSGEATPPFAPAGSEPVTALAWSPDAKSILTGQARRKGQPTIRCWSLAGKKELFAVGADEPSVRHVAWAGDGKTALVTRAAALAVINAAAGATWRTFPANDLALRGKPALAGDGQTIAWPCSDNTIHFWNPHSGQVRPVVQAQGTLRGVQWHPDGKRLLVNAGTLVVVNTVSGRTLRTLEGKDYQAAALSRDGQRVFAARAGAARTDKSNSADIFVLDARTGRALAVLTAGLGAVEHLQISPDGALLAGAAGAAIHVWDLSALNAAGDPGEKVERIAGRPKAEISGDGRVTDLAFAPQGQTLAALRAGGAIDLWTPEGQRALGGVRPTRPESFVWSADGKRLTLFRRGAGAVVIDADTGALIREYAHQPEHYFVFGREKIVHCFSNRMEIYAAASNWELSATFLPLPGGQSLAVSADGYFTGTEGVENDIVFVAGTPGGFSCQSPADFAKTFNRPNNPAFVTP
ncbi:MAG: hypothetical protein NT031_10210, partial [Planctomycetota bacterium]|nr:hypothetical protein [Planctomycetota bacterium]